MRIRPARRQFLRFLSGAIAGWQCGFVSAAAENREPVQVLRGAWTDDSRKRTIPWALYAPAASEDCAWVVYSHGLGGSREGGDLWGRYWASNGIASLHIQHAGSDAELINSGEAAKWRKAMSGENLALRAADLSYAITSALDLRKRGFVGWQGISGDKIGAAGHSFGALTVQAAIGQRFAPSYSAPSQSDVRIKAGLALSPSARDADPQRAFGQIALPVMFVTGTRDLTPLVGEVAVRDRLLPFEGSAPGNKYLLVFKDGVHASFSGSSGRRLNDDPAASERIIPLVQAASLLFWQAHLNHSSSALAALKSLPSQVPLDAADTFLAK